MALLKKSQATCSKRMPWLQAAAPLTHFLGTCREPLRTTGVDNPFRLGTKSFATGPAVAYTHVSSWLYWVSDWSFICR